MNINDHAYVRLTKFGKKILRKHDKDTHAFIKAAGYTGIFQATEPQESGYYEFQLWDLMNIFGGHFKMGFEVPFVDCEILFEEPKP